MPTQNQSHSQNWKTRIPSALVLLALKVKKNIQFDVSQQFCGETQVDLLLKWRKDQYTMFPTKILIHLCVIIHYIVKGKWCLVGHLNPETRHLAWITKAEKDFAKRLDFKDMNFPVKVINTPKVIKKNSVDISVFCSENKEKHSIYVSKQFCGQKHVDFLLKWEAETNTMFWSKILMHLFMMIHYIVDGKWCLVGHLFPQIRRLA